MTFTGVYRARKERSKVSKAWNRRGEARFEDPISIYTTWIPEDDEITSPRWSFGKLQERRIITTTHHQSLREHLECLSLLFFVFVCHGCEHVRLNPKVTGCR